MSWHVWCDGSCVHGYANVPKRTPGWGGWCAIVEHGSDGVVLRGRVPQTTNVRMELVAAIEGLRAIPDKAGATLHTDCTTVLYVHERWRLGGVGRLGPDARLWLELDGEFERVGADVWLIVKGDRDPIHRRAHVIAGSEARGGMRGLAANAAPLDDLGGSHRIRQGMRRHLVRDPVAAARVQARRRASEAVLHLRGCEPGRCLVSCPVWLRDGSAVYGSVRPAP